jgi:gamma-glutamylcyclotransferase (GGCT)/AIG2-like uncharacterized protein YtfP
MDAQLPHRILELAMLYFAYGSNLYHTQMFRRCPGAKFIGPAILKDYKLIFDGYSKEWHGAVAGVVPEKDSEVRGGLFEINSTHLKKLDEYENYGRDYDRQRINIETNDRQLEAVIYLRSNQKNIYKQLLKD